MEPAGKKTDQVCKMGGYAAKFDIYKDNISKWGMRSENGPIFFTVRWCYSAVPASPQRQPAALAGFPPSEPRGVLLLALHLVGLGLGLGLGLALHLSHVVCCCLRCTWWG